MRPGAIVLPLLISLVSPLGTPRDARADTPPGSHVADPDAVRKRLGVLAEFASVPGVDHVKVAVLDYGFAGIGDGRLYLPATAEIVEHYDPEFIRRNGLGDTEYKKGFEPGNRHGRDMAQIVWAVTGSRPSGPKFYLLNANGPTLLRRAVRYAIEKKIDVIVFSGSFEGGGNGDGRGPIDRAVDEAVSAGILWVNSSGNYGKRVYEGPIRVLNDGYLRLREGRDVASLRFRNRLDDNAVTITLTWNDYREEEDAGTDKDLDLIVEDPSGRRLGAGEKVQISAARATGADESRNPRERVVLTSLPAVPTVLADPDYCYRVRIKAKGGRFTANDRIRVLITSAKETYLPPGAEMPREAIDFLDATGSGEIFPPADHPLVLTVGDSAPDSSVGPTTDRRVKPDTLLEDSRVFFTDGQIASGSSDAAAYIAGVVTLLKASAPGLRPSQLLRIAREGPVVTPRGKGTQSLHVWQTPTRARLAAILRDAR